MTRARHGTYLFRRRGSQNWHVKLRSNGRRVEKSLGTTDRREAEILALPLVSEHKQALHAARPRVQVTWVQKHKPGLHVSPDGERIFADDRQLYYLDADGAVIRKEPNGGLAWQDSHHPNVVVGLPPSFKNMPRRELESLTDKVFNRPPPTKSGDDGVLQTYLSHRNIGGYDRREAETVWALFKQLGKPLKDATRDDGRKLVARFKADGNKTATINKKIGWLRAACEMAIDENKLKFNPFSNIVPKDNDETERLPLDDEDMKVCRANLDKLDGSDPLLFRLLASTGMRLSEAFEINSEMKERGVRYIIIGTKTEQSKRRVPLPAGLLPFLPDKITGHLFGADRRSNHRLASKRLNQFLNDCGITDKRKVIHSLRHRAQDRLRAAGAPQDIREALLGHSKMTVGEGYGVGFPVPVLQKWVNKIGF